METHKYNIHILIPVWGEHYLSAFMNASMATLLAPQNIPFLAKECNVTTVFLTKNDSIQYIQQHDIFSKLSDICKVEYDTIDDIIADTKNYAIPLTLAYVRGVTRTGHDMTKTYFIFFTADFILSNGSMAHVLQLIKQKNDIIFATSFRARYDAIYPKIHELIDSNHGIISPRALAKISLAYKHHTVTSRIVNQSDYTNIHWNQIYWQVDSQTILARYFLTTIFCFRPTVFNESIDSFFDYNIIASFCPTGKATAIEDSDDFFLLEMQNFQQELYLLKMGKPDSRSVADSVSAWTTAWHRSLSRYETVIHGGDLPDNLEEERCRFHNFMGDMEKRLTPHPICPQTHHHWVGALRYWTKSKMRYDREHQGPLPCTGMTMPLARLDASMEKKTQGRLAQIIAYFLGVPPKAYPWHPLWENYRAIRKTLESNCPRKQELLFITDSFFYDGIVMEHGNVTKIFAADAMNGHLDKLCSGKKFSACFIAVECDNLDIQRMVKNIAAHLEGAQTIMIFFGRTMTRLSPANKHFMDVYYHAMSDLSRYKPHLSHVGNWVGLTLTAWMLDAIRRVKLNPVWHLPQMIAVALACLVNNLSSAFFAFKGKTPGVIGVLAVFSLKGDKAS